MGGVEREEPGLSVDCIWVPWPSLQGCRGRGCPGTSGEWQPGDGICGRLCIGGFRLRMGGTLGLGHWCRGPHLRPLHLEAGKTRWVWRGREKTWAGMCQKPRGSEERSHGKDPDFQGPRDGRAGAPQSAGDSWELCCGARPGDHMLARWAAFPGGRRGLAFSSPVLRSGRVLADLCSNIPLMCVYLPERTEMSLF